MLHTSIIELVGNTHVLRLCRMSERCGANIFIKLEQLNPGGSHKVRIAINMVLHAEARGVLTRGSGQTILAPTGGNTGIGLAIVAAVFGYRLILVIPDNYSAAKQRLLRLYGAQIVLSDSALGNNSHGEKATELAIENPHYVLLDQQSDPANPDAHRKATALEILEVFSGTHIDYFIGGIGTGGHITGIGEVLKRVYPLMRIIGVQPEGCDLLGNRFVRHSIQGLAVGIIPANLRVDLIDRMISVDIAAAKEMVYTAMRQEGVSVGLSTGANLAAAHEVARAAPPGANILTLAYDAAEPYLDELAEEMLPCAASTEADDELP